MLTQVILFTNLTISILVLYSECLIRFENGWNGSFLAVETYMNNLALIRICTFTQLDIEELYCTSWPSVDLNYNV